MPEPRYGHGTVCVDKSYTKQDGTLQHVTQLIVAGGITTFNVDMGQGCEPPACQTVYMLTITHGADHRISAHWIQLPNMNGAGALHPTLMVVENRYVYQVSGNHRGLQQIARLDLHTLNTADASWEKYEINHELTKVPFEYLSHEFGFQDESQRFVSSGLEDPNRKSYIAPDSQKALSKCQMGCFRVYKHHGVEEVD